jgi:putative intracellular protease/amidase
VLRDVKDPSGESVIKGKRVTGFSNSEEAAVGLTSVVPFLIEDAFVALGAIYCRGADWQPHAEVDGLIVTGQNPASAEPAVRALLALLKA